jgi:tagatose-1,6-bisphosphate aldolase
VSKKQKLITDTGTGLKVIINLDVADKVMNQAQLAMLKRVLADMHYIQQHLK